MIALEMERVAFMDIGPKITKHSFKNENKNISLLSANKM